MLILSRVCAEFRDRAGNVVHRITPAMIGLFHEAPEAVREDMLFGLLLADGSIKTPEDAKVNRNLEQDPMAGATADGRDRAREAPAKGTKSRAEGRTAESEVKK